MSEEVKRGFDFARKRLGGEFLVKKHENGEESEVLAYPIAKLPEYQTNHSAGADFFCAEEVVIPSIWSQAASALASNAKGHIFNWLNEITDKEVKSLEKEPIAKTLFKPTLIHTGIKAYMGEDEVLELYNRSSNPIKKGLILANGVGVVDADYVDNKDNDGEIMFAFYNLKPWSVTVEVGERIGQGVFKKFLRPTFNGNVKSEDRAGGFGSTEG